MNSKTNLIYVLAAISSLALGLGVSFWRAATEASELRRAHHAAEMALSVARDEIKFLHGRLSRESKAREHAHAAQAAAERAERAAHAKLEKKAAAHLATEAALARAVTELRATSAKLASTMEALRATEEAKAKLERTLRTKAAQLVRTEESRQSIETAWQRAEYTVIIVTGRLKEEIAAREAAERALARAGDQIRTGAKPAPETPAKDKAEAPSMIGVAVAPAASEEEANRPEVTKQLAPATAGKRAFHVREVRKPMSAVR